jgi:hypothetical protein
MLSVIMLSVVMLSVVKLSVFMQSVVLPWVYAQIIFQAGFTNLGVSIRMLEWLDGARTPPK